MSVKQEPGTVKTERGSAGTASVPEDAKGGDVKGQAAGASQPTGYRDIPLYSMDTQGGITHLMKFAHHNRVDPNDPEQFIPPLKLNRKMPLRRKMPPAKPGDEVPDRFNRPVITQEGKPLRWPAPGDDLEAIRPYLDADQEQADGDDVAPGSGMRRGKLFKKRVREVHKSADAARRTRNEEFFPWVLEDFETLNEWESSRDPLPNSLQSLAAYYNAEMARREANEDVKVGDEKPFVKREDEPTNAPAGGASHAPWVGQLEGDSDENSTSHHVLFVFDERNAGGFKVVPVRRLYKFMQTPRHAVLNEDQVEEEFQRFQRSTEADRWMMRSRFGTGAGTGMPMASTRRGVPSMPGLALPNAGIPQGWSSSQRLVAVRGDQRDEDDEDGLFGRRQGGSTFDELDYDETFADDEERADGDVNEDDQDAKELEQRLKREMLADHVDDDAVVKQDPDAIDSLFDESGGRGDDAQLTGTGRQMRKIMRALSRREGNDVYESDEDERNPYASDESEDDADLDVLHPERAILEAREERARQERQAREGAEAEAHAGSAGPSRAGSPEADGSMGTKRKGEADRRNQGESVKRVKVQGAEGSGRSTPSGGSPRSSSPPRTLSPLEAEIAQLIREGRIGNTADLVQHFRQRLKQDATLKETLSAAVKKIAYMDKKNNRLKLKDGF